VALAWGFVIARVLHSLVHLLYNDVLHRLAVFSVGVIVLGAMWVRLALSLI
jgi:hypothetical protein